MRSYGYELDEEQLSNYTPYTWELIYKNQKEIK